MAERTAKVATVKISPQKLVGYVGDSVTFVAMGADIQGQPAHGAKFSWESSDTSKLTIDEAGRANLLNPGLVQVIAHAGVASQTALVLIRPTRHPLQTDDEWRADQNSLVGDGRQQTDDGQRDVVATLMNSIAPTAYAQSGQGSDYGNAAYVGQVGTPPFTALEDTRLGPVMPENNFELPIPLVNLGGRGLATSLTAYYNSNVWGAYFDPIRNGTVYAFDPIQGWPGPGFSLGFGRIVYYNFDGTNYTYMLIDPNGTRHVLGTGPALTNSTLYTTDGTHITFVGNAINGGTLYFNDGTAVTIGKVNNRLLPTQITDTNGNYVQVAYVSNTSFPGIAINYIVDTLGRVIQFNYGQWPAPTSTSLSSITTPTGTITFSYQNVTLNYSFPNVVAADNAPASFYGVSGLSIPQRPTYSFSYSGYGMIYSASAASSGGTATVTYNYPLGGEDLYGGPTFTQRTESPNAVYNYTWNGVTTKLFLSGPDRQIVSTTNTTLAQTVSTMTTDPGGSTAIQSAVSYNDIGQQTKVDFDYDQYGNVVNKREYGYQINGAWQVRRRTNFTYLGSPWSDSYIRNRPSEIDVFDALQNTNDADDVLIGKTLYGYDNYNAMAGMETYGGTAAPPGHLSSYDATVTTRGNLTGVASYTDVGAGTSVTHSNKLDIFGDVTKAQVDCCNQKSFTMTQGTYWSRPAQTTSGDTSGIYLTSSASYDFNSLVAISQTNPDNQTTTYSYDAQQNPTGFNSPTSASGTTAYNAFGERTSSTVNYNDGGTNKSVTTSAVYDGWGQMTSSVDANGAQTNYTYDNMGHRLTQTNPFPQRGTPGPVTSYQYDQLGRMTQVTLQDGNTAQTSYSGSVVTVTDQVNRKIKRESDGLRRLIKVTEQDVSTGSLTQETTYTYDVSDRLTGVTQGSQTRAFKYDSEGHLLFERIPEMTATINDGTGTYWSTKYTYTSFGAVATKQDARGVITTYGYDGLNRLTSISYNTSGATGVATTPNVTYNYDNNQSSSTSGLLLSLSAGSGYSESYSYDSFKRVQSITRTIDGHNYTSSYQQNTASQLTQMTYPSGRVINLGHDSVGRVTSVGSYLTGVTYNNIGQLTGTTLGNGVTEGYGYDANRMQLTSQTATQSGGAANGLMNLTYAYTASAGQMGAGTSAGNAGQLMNVSGTIGGSTESAAYTYDDLGRLTTSNQTSNGSSAQRRFAYDRWGNRTGMWDATSGGNQIQTIALEQSGGAPTNRIQSVTSSGGPTPAAYWKFDETSGTTAADSSGNGNTGTLENGPTWTTGKINNGVNLDGVNDDVLVNSSATVSPSTAVSVAAWFKATSTGTYQFLINKFNHNSGTTSDDSYTLGIDPGGNLYWQVATSLSTYLMTAAPPVSVLDGQFHHIAATYDGTLMKVYLDGGLLSSMNASGTIVVSSTPVLLGASLNNGARAFFQKGVLDEARIYNQALSASEVQALSQTNPGASYAYDSAGNVTNDGVHVYQYDAENRLVNVDGGATGQYSYDPSNRRYKKVAWGLTTHSVWQGSQLIAEYDGSTAVVTAEYVYSGTRMVAKVSSGVTQYFLSDRLSLRLMLDASGNVIGRQGHMPFGEDFGESGGQEKHHFTSYQRDSETGLDYAVNRSYSGQTGSFQQVDALSLSPNRWLRMKRYISLAGRHTGRQLSFVAYDYSLRDPINRKDPTGLDCDDPSNGTGLDSSGLGWDDLMGGAISNPFHPDPLTDTINAAMIHGGSVDSQSEEAGKPQPVCRKVNWKCIWKMGLCLLAINAYIEAMGGLATLCADTAGLGCILALLAHPIIAGAMVEACADGLRACGLARDSNGNWGTNN